MIYLRRSTTLRIFSNLKKYCIFDLDNFCIVNLLQGCIWGLSLFLDHLQNYLWGEPTCNSYNDIDGLQAKIIQSLLGFWGIDHKFRDLPISRFESSNLVGGQFSY